MAARDEWGIRFAALADDVSALLPVAAVEHIGSTAAPDMESKDVVDVLIGVDSVGIRQAAHVLETHGFTRDGERPGHVWLTDRRGGSPSAVLHVVEVGGGEWSTRLAFRDLLRRDANARSLYIAVKRGAAARGVDWTDYTARKAAAVRWLLARSAQRETTSRAMNQECRGVS